MATGDSVIDVIAKSSTATRERGVSGSILFLRHFIGAALVLVGPVFLWSTGESSEKFGYLLGLVLGSTVVASVLAWLVFIFFTEQQRGNWGRNFGYALWVLVALSILGLFDHHRTRPNAAATIDFRPDPVASPTQTATAQRLTPIPADAEIKWDQPSPQTATADAQRLHFEKIARVHPDSIEVAQSAAFQAWVDGQAHSRAVEFRRIAERGTADEVIALLTEFKAAMRRRQINAAPQIHQPTEDLARRIEAGQVLDNLARQTGQFSPGSQ